MADHETFRFKSLEDLNSKIGELSLNLKAIEDTSKLAKSLKLGEFTLPNRIAIQPMEGCDGLKNGAPSELTIRRYKRFGMSGVGLCWFEANAVKEDARANPRQLWLTEENKNDFRNLLKVYEAEEEGVIKNNERQGFGKSLKILQITHSGRYSAPGYKNPQRMYWYDVLDKAYGRTREDGKILNDEELDALPDYFEETARLAKEIGFDGVDIKSCHRYLLSESLSAFTREDSKYGGESYENRTRLVKSIIQRLQNKHARKDFLITLRINIFDGIPYPYGWGVKKEKYPGVENFTNRSQVPEPDLSEPIQLLKELHEIGIELADLTIANPYFNPFISRPYDSPVKGATKPLEHPLEGVDRFITLTRNVRKELPNDLKLLGTGYSWLRQFGGNVAADQIAQGNVDIVGWGRMAFANPEFGKQLLIDGLIDKKKTCITCSKCTELMRMHSVAGCAIRDKEVYGPYLKGEKKVDW